jgi:Protein of unknown function (DUF692)
MSLFFDGDRDIIAVFFTFVPLSPVTHQNSRTPPSLNYALLERVIEVHLAGGFEHHGFWLDAHSGEVPEPLWLLAEAIVPKLARIRQSESTTRKIA